MRLILLLVGFLFFYKQRKRGKKWPQLVHLRKKSRYTSHAGSHAHFYQGSMIIVRIQTMLFSIYRYQPSQLWRLCRWQLLRRGGGCEVEGETDQYAEASVLQAELCVYLLTSARLDICQHVPLYWLVFGNSRKREHTWLMAFLNPQKSG